ncbi:DUF2189 domain-containing protein [Thiocystis violacea]|uniref:DUF2189 domain-containing protein n=1 Tax=Thiocystis violacea TaxID=13725 RepID=UPI00190302BE|nr:DUF2189 domain-containing protein [Thiocystis violacea]MBK1718234.1 hypothetical protein [Thiocystis violacea]
MKTQAVHPDESFDAPSPSVRHVDIGEPLDWLASGARTFAHAPVHSLLYGALFTAACWLALWLVWSLPWFTIAFITGLLLLGPFLAAGLYVAARQQEMGRSVGIRDSLELLWERRTNLSLFVLFLGLVAAAWVRFSSLLFAFQFDAFSPSIDSYRNFMIGQFDPIATGFFLGIGLLLAGVVFVTSSVAIPLILDRDAGPITGIQTSARAFSENWPAMLLWAALIVVMTGIGILTAFVGMIAIFPWLGYATWHSYRSLVARDAGDESAGASR